ncbi:hypothetical protein AYJ54_36330 [Bradyrhizobium centrolobii]|uniref:Uncharacterized protein n=1 Tax=Bradyrhizobium centrolobii TaxID=1505087 RepID=A0A176Y8H4_9BRAD|nr:hypothetical protein [Bradyrhizobium centrolobii]OAE96750.1 hypothetical protein AYJ54_36330 [Bradyrhizobium centrolobii]
MAEDTSASVISLHQVPRERKDKTAAARAKAYRQRKRQQAKLATSAEGEPSFSEYLTPPELRVGFAAANIGDVTLARASRVTPAVTTAQAALLDAMSVRDGECKGGVGRFCRKCEAAVAERRQALQSEMAFVRNLRIPKLAEPSGWSAGASAAHCGRPPKTSPC